MTKDTEAKSYLKRGDAYFKEGKYDQAVADFTKAIECKPDDVILAAAYYGCGSAYAKQKKYDQAVADFTKVIEYNLDFPEAYNARGIIYAEQEKYDQAIKDYDKAIEIKPDYAAAYYNRGNAYGELGKHDWAIEDFDKAIEIKPDYAIAYNNRGSAYAKQKKYNRAIADYNKAIKLNPDNAFAYNNRGLTYDKQEKYDRAIEDYDQAIKLKNNFAVAYHNRGNAYAKQKKYDQAIEDYGKLIQLKPDKAIAYFARGTFYFIQGKYKLAIEDYDKAIQLKLDVDALAAAHYTRGVSYLNKNKYKLAFKDFLNCNKYDENAKKIYTHIYIVYEINNIFSEKDEKEKSEIFKLIINLLNVIINIKKELFYKPNDSLEIAHYTSLHVLKDLTLKNTTGGNNNFRLYNTAYMNDRQEGDSFFDMIKEHDQGEEDYARKFYKENKNYSPSAYVGSFVEVDDSKKEKDILSLWRLYGKHDDEEAAGACLIFKHDSSRFADTASKMIGTMEQLEREDKKSPVTTNKGERKLELYEIVYENDYEKKEKLSKEFKKLAGLLKEKDKSISELENEEQRQGMYKIVCEILDLIRFLFKTEHYMEEKEVRVVKINYSFSDSEQPNDEKIQTDDKEQRFPPRFYLNAPDNFCFGEVIIGPQAGDEDEWQVWGKQQKGNYKNLKIVKSKIPYGKK